MHIKHVLISLLAFLFSALIVIAQANPDPAVADHLSKARQFVEGQRFDEALAEYKRADEIAQGKSYEAAVGLSKSYRALEDFAQAETSALRAAELAPNKSMKKYSLWNAGMAAMKACDKIAPKCADAEREFRSVIQIDSSAVQLNTRYFLGRLLLKQNRDEEAIAELKAFLASAPQDKSSDGKLLEFAQQLIEEPSRGRASLFGLARKSADPESRNALNASNSVPVADTMDAAVRERFAKGQQLVNARKYDDAIKEFKTASKAAHESSFEVLIQLAVTYQAVNAHKNALEAASRAATVAVDDVQRARAHSVAGISLMQLGETKPEKYMDAENEFRTALQLAPTSEFAHFNLGMALLKQSRDPEGVAEIKLFLEQHPNSSAAARAQTIADNPRRAREIYIPEFSITTMDGEYISSSELLGKVVVLDFWASWCGPCRASLGDLRSFSKHFSDKSVVLISVSADKDEQTWRSFVEKNNMKWTQCYDEGGKIARLFSVHAYPSYFVIDSEGIFRMKVLGGGNFQVGAVQNEVKKWLKKMDEGSKKKETASAK